MHFRDLAGVGEVHDLAGLGRDQKNVPLLVAIVVRLVSNPLSIRRPCRRTLALVADGELCRPAALGGHQPQVIAAADVADKGDRLPIRRPGRSTHRPCHIELLNGKIFLDLRIGLAGNLLGIGNGLRRRQSLRQGERAHNNHDNKENESSHVEVQSEIQMKEIFDGFAFVFLSVPSGKQWTCPQERSWEPTTSRSYVFPRCSMSCRRHGTDFPKDNPYTSVPARRTACVHAR